MTSREAEVGEKVISILELVVGVLIIYSLVTEMYHDDQPSIPERFLMNKGETTAGFSLLISGLMLLLGKKSGWILSLCFWGTFLMLAFSDIANLVQFITFIFLLLFCLLFISFLTRKPFLIKYKASKIDLIIILSIVIPLAIVMHFFSMF